VSSSGAEVEFWRGGRVLPLVSSPAAGVEFCRWCRVRLDTPRPVCRGSGLACPAREDTSGRGSWSSYDTSVVLNIFREAGRGSYEKISLLNFPGQDGPSLPWCDRQGRRQRSRRRGTATGCSSQAPGTYSRHPLRALAHGHAILPPESPAGGHAPFPIPESCSRMRCRVIPSVEICSDREHRRGGEVC
jgi:hypothetical protein